MSHDPAADEFVRFPAEYSRKAGERLTLADFAALGVSKAFVATVAERGFIKKRRTVLLRDLRIFGVTFIMEDHLWVPYNQHWTQIEPFYQGQKVVLVGTAFEYVRKDKTCDYSLNLQKVAKLWRMGCGTSEINHALLGTPMDISALLAS